MPELIRKNIMTRAESYKGQKICLKGLAPPVLRPPPPVRRVAAAAQECRLPPHGEPPCKACGAGRHGAVLCCAVPGAALCCARQPPGL